MIQHHMIPNSVPLSLFLQQEIGLPEQQAVFLRDFGAIYVNHRRQRQECQLQAGDYVRAHVQPRRFPVGDWDWNTQIFAQTPEFVVVLKPHCIPTHATVDNWQENACHQISEVLQKPVLVTHRLDVATAGLLVFGLTKPFQSAFNKALTEGRVQKHYVAHTDLPVEERGVIEHWMEPSTHLPKKISRVPVPGWLDCRLEILHSSPDSSGEGHWVEIRLLTGRTHQIRAQLADLGRPIQGDKLYGGSQPWSLLEKIGLVARQVEFQLSPFDPVESFLLPDSRWR